MVAWRWGSRTLGFLATFVLARVLVPADFGVIAMATAFAAAVDSLSQLRVQDALIRSDEVSRTLYDSAFTLQLIRGAITACLIVVATPHVAAWFQEPRLVSVMLVLAATSLIGSLENVAATELRRDLQFRAQFLILAIPRICQVALTIPLAYVFHSYWALLSGIVLTRVLALLLSYAVRPFRPRLTLRAWRSLVGFSFWSWTSSIAVTAWARCDPFILGRSFGSGELGAYLTASDIALLPISELVAPAADVLFPGFAAARKTGSDMADTFMLVITTLLIGVVPAAIAISASAGCMVPVVLGSVWISTGPMIAVLSLLCLFSPISYVCSTLLVSCGFVRQNCVAISIAATIKIAVVFAASRTLDLNIVAWATVICVGAESVLFLQQFGRLGFRGVSHWIPALLRIALAGISTAALLWLSGYGWTYPTEGSLLTFAKGITIGASAILLFATTLCAAWRAGGKPAGPERRLAEVLTGLVASQRGRWSLQRRVGC
jgi:lipopolysaccharide exporter